ncbi:inositol-3-phosphate synthase [Vulcanisaeta souniana]|uniref:Myo-inositol-1-phosphate synthase n=1 Tax=Vulcanisaeta souniana JCM 11219 TaxID=1293586 RepID=A0A830EMM9_9CREN|nr:inositol-3-phosphate synthase [Vulcanisaeta souniana]BDR92922.1 myo-inositol-1-phosphate synthase [Vulcanisaeta souniana JCM 11219]GGI85604.1 myo-inositol-1-phosphate synthase [Vulcanisaeta souniana JCM 11219]
MKSNIRVAIAGVGNTASAFVQGLRYCEVEQEPTGLTFQRIGPYEPRDIKVVAAFDVDSRKVGKDVGEAIFTQPNNALKVIEVGKLGVIVKAGPLLDGVAEQLRGSFIPITESAIEDVVRELESTNTHILINYLPTGAQKASEAYAEAALRSGSAFVNAMPSVIATSSEWQSRFETRKLPLAGDDVQNQVGATVLHKTIIRLLALRGVKIEGTYQLNVGGTPDFLNLMYRKGQKEKTKTEAVKKMAEGEDFDAYISPVAYIKFLGSRKNAHMFIEARGFANVPIRIRVDLEVYDPFNNAGVMIDIVRTVKLAMDREIGGPLISLSAWAFKNPPVHAPPDVAYQWLVEFIEGKRNR